MRAERLRLGFIALDDAAPLIAAAAQGCFADEGLDVELVREVSWATVRDKVDVGALDGAHMLAPMALATGALATGALAPGALAPGALAPGAGGELAPLIAPLALNLNGPAVTLSSRLAASVEESLPKADGLARLVTRRRQEGASPITLAVVYPLSTHNYLLRAWLSRAGIDPDHDVRLTIVPPARTAEFLAEGIVEGVCVGEPWGAQAVAAGVGVTCVRASQLWPRTPDKVFAMRADTAAADPARLQAILRALLRGAAWADAPENRLALADLLAEPGRLGVAAGVIAASLADLVFHADGANAPQPVHADWLIRQMMRWGHLPPQVDARDLTARVYRMDLYRQAAASLGLPEAPALAGFGDA
jgi:NitT/TauT family transport system ATP-binding protein/nitrate/nitrite transport system substrate-binding protein